jgi:hypothetical protein
LIIDVTTTRGATFEQKIMVQYNVNCNLKQVNIVNAAYGSGTEPIKLVLEQDQISPNEKIPFEVNVTNQPNQP